MAGVERSFDAAKRALERAVEAAQKSAADTGKQEKKETKKVEDSKDKASLGRVEDKKVKPRALDKDAQHNSLSHGFGEGTQEAWGKGEKDEHNQANPKPQTKDQKVNKEWEKAAKASSKAAETKQRQEKPRPSNNNQESEFLVSLYSTQDYYSLATKNDPKLQELNSLLDSINGDNSKEENTKNHKKLQKLLFDYIEDEKNKAIGDNIFTIMMYKLHEKIKSSPKLQAQGLKTKPIPPSIRPQLDIIEAKAQSDDKYYSGLLTAIAGNTIYVNTASYVQQSNSRLLGLHSQEIEQIKQENEQRSKNQSGYETLIGDSVDDGVSPEKAKQVIEAASTNILVKQIEKTIASTPKAKLQEESAAKTLVDGSTKRLKSLDKAFEEAIYPLQKDEPKLKDILKRFKSLKKEAKPEANSEIVNEIIASLDSVKSTYAKELVLYSLKLKAKEINLDSEVSKLDGKLKTLQSTKVDPRARLYANLLQVTFIHAGFHRPGKKPEHVQEDLKAIKKYFAKKFKEPEAKVEALVNREYRYFSDKYPKRVDI